MSVEQIESTLLGMSPEERLKFARWFYDHEDQLVEISGRNIAAAQTQKEILRRHEELRSNPSFAVPVTEEWFANLKKKFADAPVVKASAA